VGAQLILWTLSGLMFAWLDHHEVMAQHSVREPSPPHLSSATAVVEPGEWLAQYEPADVVGITLIPRGPQWFYRIQLTDRAELRRADTGQLFEIDAGFVRTLAQARYAGEGTLASIENLVSTPEARDAGAVWQVRFDDESATSLYFSAADARFVVARNDTWRVFDFFWMLHTMDYRGRDNFNNPLVISAGTGALWLGLSGFILLFRAFRMQELNPAGWWRQAPPLKVRISTAGTVAKEIELRNKPSLYAALQATGVELPSNCGGGGSCGLCVVRFTTAAPEPTSEEHHFIAQSDLNAGFRLACRHFPTAGAAIEVPESALSHREWNAEVTGNRFVTPTIRELRLRVPREFEFRAGDYVQIAIPPHRLNLADVVVPEPFDQGWDRLRAHASTAHPRALRRAYSMANFPGESPGELVLNVRLSVPPFGQRDAPCGAGSTFLFHASAGDRLRLYGPFGTFHATHGSREMVFIGGGAGMAPLRALILDQLRNHRTQRRISYWFGARSALEMFYAEEFEQLAAECPNFTWHPAVSEASTAPGSTTHIGHIHEVVAREFLSRHADPGGCEYYLCGPPVMLEACRKLLSSLHVPDEHVFFDDFGS
jgi:Na(+)-translocating NADH:ubiquinone oxidoreductase F subunit